MEFIVIKKATAGITSKNDCFFLSEDKWDDWFQFVTSFDTYYIDNNGKRTDLGSVKIGVIDQSLVQTSHEKKERFCTINLLPRSFTKLADMFFSLGQSADYYDNIRQLEDEKRIAILESLNDVAYNLDLYSKIENLEITQSSIMRSVSSVTVQNQFHRIALGGIKLTEYNFTYYYPSPKLDELYYDTEDIPHMSFEITPDSIPPTNVHVIIGRNGVGKTYFLKNIIQAAINVVHSYKSFGKLEYNAFRQDSFSNIVCVAFSAFDEYPFEQSNTKMPYLFIGLSQESSSHDSIKKQQQPSRLGALREQFRKSYMNCKSNSSKIQRWMDAVDTLSSDPIFCEAGFCSFGKMASGECKEAQDIVFLFDRLSSGHKIILLTITQLIEKVEEKTLVLLDEPETHLHPPLLSAFIRSLSDLLIKTNGVAIITTHSPVVIQEVPKSCVWKVWRYGSTTKVERPAIETYGENISTLINEVFGLEVVDSGFHKMLNEAVEEHHGDYYQIVESFNGQLGSEAKAILRALISQYKDDDSK